MNDKRRAYIREWQRTTNARRRREWTEQNGPCVLCGSDKELEVDHVNRLDKVSHGVWSWAKPRREAELKKCQVLCHKCHKLKSASECRALFSGKEKPDQQTISDSKFTKVIKLCSNGMSERDACSNVGIARGTFSSYKSMGMRKRLFIGQ